MAVNLSDYAKTFLGKCLGIGVTVQDETNVLLVHFLVEDDESWHELKSGCFSSYWLPDFRAVMKEFEAWLEANTTDERWGRSLRTEVQL